MRYLVNGGQMKAADRYTIQEFGTPSMVLMERAAARCVEFMVTEGLDLSRPCIVCGAGNNGGDGLAIARLLAEDNHIVRVCLIGKESHCTCETKQQLKRLRCQSIRKELPVAGPVGCQSIRKELPVAAPVGCQSIRKELPVATPVGCQSIRKELPVATPVGEIGIEICNEYVEDEYSIIIDAIFGVGLSREITGEYLQTIRRMNEADAIKFAVDMPSGVSADQGSVLGIAFRADFTVTFQAEKLGLAFYPGREYAGRVMVADIGIDMDQTALDCETACIYDDRDYRRMLPVRKPDSNKGTYGKLLVIAGSKGMSGAAYLNAKAAYMTGTGLVRIYTPEENRVILQQLLPEAIVTTYENYDESEVLGLLDWADAVCIGSGIGMGDVSRRIWETVLEHAEVPCLVDADGLNLLSEHRQYLDIIKEKQLVVTPHMKEMSRLVQLSVEEIKAHRMEVLEEYTGRCKWVCVLKDSRTVVSAPEKHPCVNPSGNAAMAKAGAGDVLAGVIAALLAQGMERYDAAVLGTYLHGRSGDYARKIKGSYSVLAEDLVECLSDAIKEIETAGGV